MSKNNADLLRTRLRELRQTLSVAERQHDSTALCARLQAWFDQRLALNDVSQQSRPLIVAGFWPLEYEPDLRPLLHQLDQNQVTVCLPVIVERHAPLEFHRWTPSTTLTAQGFGVMEPARQQALIPDILLVPTLGFTTKAGRLGYGGGTTTAVWPPCTTQAKSRSRLALPGSRVYWLKPAIQAIKRSRPKRMTSFSTRSQPLSSGFPRRPHLQPSEPNQRNIA